MEKAIATSSSNVSSVTDLRAAARQRRTQEDTRSPFDVVFDDATVVIELAHDGGPFREHRQHNGEPGRWIYAFSARDLLTAGPSFQDSDADEEPYWTFRQGAALQRELPPEVGIVLDPGQPWTAIVRRPRLARADGSAT